MSSELQAFVKEALEKGQSREAIEKALAQAGWQEEEIQKALASFAEVQFPVAVPRPKPYLQAREAFLYLISFIALYISAFSFGVLAFAFIDRLFPDPLQFGGFSARGLTTALASIIIAFPLYFFMMWRLTKGAAKDPERRQSKVGKWLTYITLVIAAGIIIGDLIVVLSSLLGGELTSRFVFKALVVLAIAGSIFGYYLWSLQREEKEKDEKGRSAATKEKPVAVKIFVGAVVAVVAGAVIYGLTLVGTPAQQRLIQFDERRVQDLQSITSAIDSYWQRNDQLPETLEALRSPTYFGPSVRDPKTQEPYQYNTLSETSYELCAVFETESEYTNQPISRFPGGESFWDHGVGRTCFELEVQQPQQAENLPPVPVQ